MERHYSENYFFSERKGGKTWTDKDGKVHEFGYMAGGIWNFNTVINKLIELLGKPKSVIDLGAGCGGLVGTLNAMGIDAIGLEFSKFALENAVLGARKYLCLHDVNETPWPVKDKYDWTTMIDLPEHIFESRIVSVIAEAKRVTKRFIVAKICTAQFPHEVWAAKEDTLESVLAQGHREGYDWLTVSGHVNSQVPEYWRKKFEDERWKIRDDLSIRLRHELNLPDDWRTTLIVELQPLRSDVPETGFTQAYYDRGYFADRDGKGYRMPDGSLRRWGYMNPDGAWEGCAPIVEAWKTMFQPNDLLDAGCGRAQFVAAARKAGIMACGFDYSEYAVGEGRYAKCKPEWVRVHDATKPWPYPDRHFDLVLVLDTLEHIYVEDLPFVIDESYRVAKRWVFIQIAVAGSGGLQGTDREGYLLKKGEAVPKDLEQYAVAGHVSVVSKDVWEDWLLRDSFISRRDLVEQFKGLVDPVVIKNWVENMIYVAERLE